MGDQIFWSLLTHSLYMGLVRKYPLHFNIRSPSLATLLCNMDVVDVGMDVVDVGWLKPFGHFTWSFYFFRVS
jgi:hypothetical protein